MSRRLSDVDEDVHRVSGTIGTHNYDEQQNSTKIEEKDENPKDDKLNVLNTNVDKPNMVNTGVYKPEVDKPDVDKPDVDKSDVNESNAHSNEVNKTRVMESENIGEYNAGNMLLTSHIQSNALDESAAQSASPKRSTSFLNFQTPLKQLPALKDIESIVTPKTFEVAIDRSDHDIEALPGALAYDDTQIDKSEGNSTEISRVASFLMVEPRSLGQLDSKVIDILLQKAEYIQRLNSELDFTKTSHEAFMQRQDERLAELQKTINDLDSSRLKIEKEKNEYFSQNEIIMNENSNLKVEIASLKDRIQDVERERYSYNKGFSQQISERDQEILKLNDSLSKISKTNIDYSQKLDEVSKELSQSRNEQFSLKLSLSKANNELGYCSNQKEWYEDELKKLQRKYTDLLKKNEDNYITTSNEITSLSSKNATLVTLNKSLKENLADLNKKLEAEISKCSSLSSKSEIDRITMTKEIKSKEELLELTKAQSAQRNERVQQLEAFIKSVQENLSNKVLTLESHLSKKEEQVIILQEKIKRLEDALDSELHKETQLPKLSESAELIASNSDGISLSSLYSEYNFMKKLLILERSQKEKLASQLETFVKELETKKPVIANYREQIRHYEDSLKEMVSRIETMRMDKINMEKASKQVRSKLNESNNEVLSLKALCKDLGRQLCYYLIHCKIKDGNEDPLNAHEKKAIENILERTGDKDTNDETDTDKLISERLVRFESIIDLQRKNEGLLKVVRQLGHELENKEDNYDKGLEYAAVEEAKDAILTLEGELECTKVKLDAAYRERDALRSLQDGNLLNRNNLEINVLKDENNELKVRVKETESQLTSLQTSSSQTIKEMNNKISKLMTTTNETALKASRLTGAKELLELKHDNSQKLLNNTQEEIKQLRVDIEFWKEQVSKQESFLVSKNNELRELENLYREQSLLLTNSQMAQNVAQSLQRSLEEEISQLRNDKQQLSDLVSNLQNILKEREASNKEISSRFSQSVENYQNLQEKLNERDERISILASQSNLALKAQNTKLEQVNDLCEKLATLSSDLSRKEEIINELNEQITKFKNNEAATHRFEGFKGGPESEYDHSSEQEVISEIQKLKSELSVAESQVNEYSNMAKAAESALVTSTETFERYRKEADERFSTLQSEKEQLLSTCTSLRTSQESVDKELQQLKKTREKETGELKLKLHETEIQVTSFVHIKEDYETKMKSLSEELLLQSRLNSEYENQLKSEREKKNEMMNDIQKLQQKSETLAASVEKLESSLRESQNLAGENENKWKDSKVELEQRIEAYRKKAEDLKNQNEILFNQIELIKIPNFATNETLNTDVKELVSYLRREKDVAEGKLQVSNEEKQKLAQRLNNLSAELEVSKAELMKTHRERLSASSLAEEHQRLLDQLEQLNILRESNTTLRNENKSKGQRNSELELKINSLSADLTESEKRIKELLSDSDIKAQNLRHLKEENERLATKIKNLEMESKSSESEDITAMRQRFTNLRNEFQSKLLAHRSKTKDLEKTIEGLRSELATTSEELKNFKSSLNEKENLNSVNRENADPTTLKNAESELESIKNAMINLKEENDKIIRELTTQKLSSEAQLKEATEQNQKFKAEEEKRKSALEDEKKRLKDELEGEFNQRLERVSNDFRAKLENSSDKVTKSDIEAELTKKFEEQRKELEQKLRNQFDEEMKQKMEELSGKNESPDTPPIEEIRKGILKDHEDEIRRLKEDFSKELDQAKEDVKNMTEKKFEIKMRMLNKKIEKLGDKKTFAEPEDGLTLSSARGKSPGSSQVQAAKPSPLGHPFTESTLTVRHPAMENTNQGKPPGDQRVGLKRPSNNKSQGPNKRNKE